MSPSKSSFFLSASALNSSKTLLSSESVELIAQLAHALAEGVPAAVLAEHQIAAGQPDVLGAHDLVGRVVPKHAVLVDAGFVSKGVLADDGLVARDRHAGD